MVLSQVVIVLTYFILQQVAKNKLLAEWLHENQGLKEKLEDKADQAPTAASTGKQEETTEKVKTLLDGSTIKA